MEHKYKNKKIRKIIAQRVEMERKRTIDYSFTKPRPLSKLNFATKLGMSETAYNNLSNEYNKDGVKVEVLYSIAEECGCDIGYLLGEYKERTRPITDICKETGLSAKAVEYLTDEEKWLNKLLIEEYIRNGLPEEEAIQLANLKKIDGIPPEQIKMKDIASGKANIMKIRYISFLIEEIMENQKLIRNIDTVIKVNTIECSPNFNIIKNVLSPVIDQFAGVNPEFYQTTVWGLLKKAGYNNTEIIDLYLETDKFYYDFFCAEYDKKTLAEYTIYDCFKKVTDNFIKEEIKNGKEK